MIVDLNGNAYLGRRRQPLVTLPKAGGGFTPWTIGFDFRSTSGYVTDPTDCVYWSKELYATIKTSALGQSVTAGWDSATNLTANDRNNTTADPRVAGDVEDAQNASPNSNFRVDLPAAGVYDILMACGATNVGYTQATVTVYDNATQLFQYLRQNITSGNMLDANGNQYTYSLWPSSTTAKRVTFTSSICIVRVGNNGDSGDAPITHFHLNRIS